MISIFRNPRRLRVHLLLAALGGIAPLSLAQRSQMSLDGAWKFAFQAGEQATNPSFNDQRWQTIIVPHSWPKEGEELHDESFRTVATYRRSFFASKRWQAKRVILRFDAASLIADVYLNGTRVGRHVGGFAAFNFDITDAVRFGQQNLLAVQVSNEKNTDVSPLAGDFLIYGGLYRHVSLLLLDPVNITPLDHASSGVFVSTRSLTPEAASVEVRTELRNDTKREQQILLQTEVLEPLGKVVASSQRLARLAARETTTQTIPLTWRHPHLWDGIRDPFLYTVRVTLIRGKHPADSVTQTFGLRTIRFDPARGLILNGRAMQIRGVCLHQEGSTAGWAVSEADERQDMKLIRDMGADGIRLAHYQHSQSFLDLADTNGMLIWAELAQVDRVSASEAYRQNIRQQLVELIRQNYNHP